MLVKCGLAVLVSILLIAAFPGSKNDIKGAWRYAESNFIVDDDLKAYYFFGDSTMILSWIMDGYGLLQIGDETPFTFNNNLLITDGGARSIDSMHTVFISEAKLLLLTMNRQDTLFLIRKKIGE